MYFDFWISIVHFMNFPKYHFQFDFGYFRRSISAAAILPPTKWGKEFVHMGTNFNL